ncbi:MAG TPA: transglutaminaseTgpA domain-containing protein, partial [Steroidobacteraceae bacterium]|nr:transglutaminaseTgpA domain-containing protein [Steroidobacteraceae bacterium]
MAEPPPGRLRGLRTVAIALAVAVAPHVQFLPVWVDLLLGSVIAWRTVADARGWPLPPKWLRVTVTLAATAVVLGTYHTLNGLEAGTALLVLMAGVKLLETRSARDLAVLLFIAWFLIYAALLRSEALAQLPWLVASALLTTGALLRVHAGSAGESSGTVARRTLALTLQALPLALALFLL